MKLKAGSLALLTITIIPAFAQVPEDLKRNFDDAERRIVRLPPTAFPQLPRNVIGELQHRGCTVPQGTFTKKPHNVIRGEFAKPGQTDWAVLCSVKGVSTILVFWNGSGNRPGALAPTEDRNFLQGITPDKIGYSRGSVLRGRISSCVTIVLTVDQNRRPLTIKALTMPSLRKHP